MSILIIDNYDSFVYNLARYVENLGKTPLVRRNDKIAISEIELLAPDAIILSPGPCAPNDAGICLDLVKTVGAHMPILGVCLGHQAIAQAYGAQIIRAQTPMHGKSCMIEHHNTPLFKNLPNPLSVGRYHSLIAQFDQAHDFSITAHSPSGEIMAIEHKAHPVYGVQFHPESILTPQGIHLMENFLDLAKQWNSQNTGLPPIDDAERPAA